METRRGDESLLHPFDVSAEPEVVFQSYFLLFHSIIQYFTLNPQGSMKPEHLLGPEMMAFKKNLNEFLSVCVLLWT